MKVDETMNEMEIETTETLGKRGVLGELLLLLFVILFGFLISLIPTFIILAIWKNVYISFISFIVFFLTVIHYKTSGIILKKKEVVKPIIESRTIGMTIFDEILLKTLRNKSYTMNQLRDYFDNFRDLNFLKNSITKLVTKGLVDIKNDYYDENDEDRICITEKGNHFVR